MSNPYLKRLIEMCCRHRFTWPRAGIHGTAYQACLICGAIYSYDCSTMRRTGRLVAPDPPYASGEENQSSNEKTAG